MSLFVTSYAQQEQLYKDYLATIKGVKFTFREIDIIACIISNRGDKKIADICGISPATVSTHTHNIMVKTGCNAKDQIIDWIESSSVLKIIKEYYLTLLIKSNFEKTLRKIANHINKNSINCYCESTAESINPLLYHSIKKHLQLANIVLLNTKSDPIANLNSIKAESYYQDFFQLLFQLINNEKLNQIYSEFKDECEIIENYRDKIDTQIKPAIESSKVINEGKNITRSSLIYIMISLLFILFVYKYNFTDNQAIEESKSNSIIWDLPRQDHRLIKRAYLLKILDEQLNSKQSVDQLIVSVCVGLGGIGKTQLALDYLYNSTYNLKAWFAAENIDNLYIKYTEFAKSLGYRSTNYTKEGAIDYINRYLSENPGWILVFDNVSNYNEIMPFLPVSKGRVILTTRQREWPENFSILPIDIMTEEEALKTIGTLSQRNIDKEKRAAKELIDALGRLPLALAQAAAYIKQTHISITDYLNIYQQNEIKLLESNILPTGVKHDPVAITWNISLDAIVKESIVKNNFPIAIELLTVCAYLSPDKISRKVLLAWLKSSYPNLALPELVLNHDLGLLWKYSMINYNDDENISIHRLVQIVSQHKLHQIIADDKSLYTTLNLKWFESLLRFFIEHENEFKLSTSFPQLIKVKNQFKELFKGQYNEIMARLDLSVVSVYFFQERYEDYFKTLNEVNEYVQKNPGLDFIKCKLLYYYSAYYRQKGDYDKAENFINQALDNFKNIKIGKAISNYELKKLKSRILYNKANLTFVINKKRELINRDQKQLKIALKLLQEAIELLDPAKESRDWLRSIELQGRLLALTNNGNKILEIFAKCHTLIETEADDRTKMLFYLTYSDAYLINKDFVKALEYCTKAKLIARNLGIEKELKNIGTKENAILEAQKTFLTNSK